MPDLVAQGTRPTHRWRRRLPSSPVTVGRAASAWSVSWDEHISREHVQLDWQNGVLHVQALPSSRNPVFYQGEAQQTFSLRPGEHFVIGQTTFTLAEETASLETFAIPPVTEQTFSHEYLRRLDFRDPSNRLQILSRLPERTAAAATNEALWELVVRVVFEGVPHANAVVLCRARDEQVEFLAWDRRDAAQGPLATSQRLVTEAVRRNESIVHTWESAGGEEFTAVHDVTWSFCSPFSGPSCEGWAIYVAGKNDAAPLHAESQPDVRDELKFVEVVVSTIQSFCDVRQLQARQSALTQFFSPPVVAALGENDPEQVLAPREVDVAVLFCDLRGFTRETERSADNLLGLLKRVSDALGVLTQQILAQGGVIGDFHGDAAMGFWGWPLPQADAAARAAAAAVAIRQAFQQFAEQQEHTLANFRIGIGIASGRAVAGKIGTTDQVKVTAFGPAVNLAARLESMTKQLNAPILIDQATADQLDDSSVARTRRLAVVQPYGLRTPMDVYELLPPEDQYPLLSNEHIQCYHRALEAFVAGDWKTAWAELHHVPAEDLAKDCLTTYIASRGRAVPPDWDGVIRLQSK